MGGELTVTGTPADVNKAVDLINYLLELSFSRDITRDDITSALRMVLNGEGEHLREVMSDKIKVSGTVK